MPYCGSFFFHCSGSWMTIFNLKIYFFTMFLWEFSLLAFLYSLFLEDLLSDVRPLIHFTSLFSYCPPFLSLLYFLGYFLNFLPILHWSCYFSYYFFTFLVSSMTSFMLWLFPFNSFTDVKSLISLSILITLIVLFILKMFPMTALSLSYQFLLPLFICFSLSWWRIFSAWLSDHN